MLIFLDIDGVLNGHEWCHLGSVCRINPGPAKVLNKIIEIHSPEFFISSTWGKHIVEWGIAPFEWMFKTHGIKIKIIGGFDGSTIVEQRSSQIYEYTKNNNITNYFIFDDLNLSTYYTDYSSDKVFRYCGESRLLRTDPALGLQPYHVTEFNKMVEKFKIY